MSDEASQANELDFSGRVVIVTGGAKGVGRGITERFLEAGADVLVCGRSAPEQLPSAGGRTAFRVKRPSISLPLRS